MELLSALVIGGVVAGVIAAWVAATRRRLAQMAVAGAVILFVGGIFSHRTVAMDLNASPDTCLRSCYWSLGKAASGRARPSFGSCASPEPHQRRLFARDLRNHEDAVRERQQ